MATDDTGKIRSWRVAVILGAMFLFVLGIPSLPGTYHPLYWAVAFVVEAALCAALLSPFGKNAH